MRFSYIGGPRPRPDLNQPAAQAWRNYVSDGLLADKLGFDAFYVGEHHFCFASGTSAPMVMLAEVAARTERIRLGTSILCLPFHNPLTIAENIAAVDIVSDGRFDLGFGVGSQYEEFNTFGIPPGERFGRTWEAIDVIERCFSGEETFSHEGKYFNFPDVQWIIPPVQDNIPMFWGGFGPQGVKRAAKRGYNLIAPDITGVYCETLREMGQKPEEKVIGFAHPICVAPTKKEAIDAIADASLFVNNVYARRRNLDGTWPEDSAEISMEQLVEALHGEAQESGDGAGAIKFPPVADNPEGVIEKLLPFVRGERGLITHMAFEFRPPGVKTRDVERSMTLFANEVMPVLKAEAKY